MISHKLQTIFSVLETAAFIEWQKAGPEERERITRELGRLEAKAIISEIEEQSKYESR